MDTLYKFNIIPLKILVGFSKREFEVLILKLTWRDFPSGPVVKNPPSNAGDMDFIPGQGTKIPHAAGHLSLRATIRESTCRN